MIGSRNRCTACFGDGKCAQCDGSGINVHLNEEQAKCRSCSGTGVCPTCNGTGAWMVPPPEIIDLELTGKH
ncbi:MAG: hypothetical protein WBQ72_16695 [Terriglobales bacterium]